MEFDTLLHLSSETETPLRSINNFLLYFLLWTGGGSKLGGTEPTYLSMNQLATKDVYDAGIAKYSQENIQHTKLPQDFSNYREHYLQGYWEVKAEGDYSAVSLKHSYPISKTVKLAGRDSNWCYVTKYRRYSDANEFYFIQMSQVFKGYTSRSAYRGLSELLQYIKLKYPGLYIITGDLNVQGHEKVFEYHLGSDEYHICPLHKIITCNDNEGLASPDGLVVSRELYPRLEYAVDFYSGHSYQHFIVTGKMFAKSSAPGTYDATSSSFRNFLQILTQNYGNRDYFIGNEGIFDPKDYELLGSAKNVREVPISPDGPKTFTAYELTKELRGNSIF